MRGRGGPSRGRKGPFRPQRIVTKPVFDREFMNLGEDARISPPPDDAELTQAMVKRHADLTPTSQEQAAVLNLVTNITSAADALIVSPASFPGCQLEEVRPVGSFRKATMMRGRNVADVVIILKTMPTKEAVEQLGVKLHSDLQAVDGLAGVQLEQNDTGFILSTSDAKVRCLITTIAQNVRSLDRELHLDIKVVQAHLAAIRHSCWFEDNGRYSTVKVMIRLLKDMAARFDGFAPLKSWMIDMLAHYATMNTQDGQPLPINIAFRRVLQLLASGFFLPTSFSINDPCETSVVKVHSQMTLEEQDVVCMTAQMLVRMLAYGGYKEILGLEGNGNLNEPKVYGGVTITPPERVYERREGTTDTLEEGDGAAQMEVAE